MSDISPLSTSSESSPPVLASGSPGGAIPAPLTPILGRDDEIDQVLKLLDRDDLRLVTLQGPGGVGKTRLALEVARNAERDFAHGAWFVPLAAVRDHTLVPATVARTLGLIESPLAPIAEQLRDALQLKHLLLVLDNLEHLEGVASPWLIDLLMHCPRLKILATSRSALHLSGEQRFLVSPLPVPDPDPGSALSSPAIALFVQRARAVRPAFELNESNAGVVTDICQRLNGLPLAIVLAAARVNVLSVSEILAHLTDQLSLLTLGRHDPAPRLRSMRDAIAWSYDLLTPTEQELFRRLSVFVGGFTLDAVERVCVDRESDITDPSRDHSVIDLIGSLVDQSLIALDNRHAGDSRFTMLATVHTFAREQLRANGEAENYEARHADWCLHLAENAEARLVREVDASWLNLLEAEHGNLRSALEWSLAPSRTPTGLALRIVGAVWLFWYYHSHLFEGRRWLERALRESNASTSKYRAKALAGFGHLAHCQGDDGLALVSLTESVAISRSLEDPWATAFALSVRGNLSEDQGNYDEARSFFVEAKTLFDESGDQVNVAVTLYHLSVVAYGQGDLDQALDQCDRAVALARGENDPWTLANALSCLGLIQIDRNEGRQAAVALSEALDLYVQIATTEQIVEVFRRIAVLAQVSGDALAAVRLFSAANAIGGRIGTVQALPERAAYDRAIGEAQRALPAGDYEAAWDSGQRLSLADALAEAHACLGSGQAPLRGDLGDSHPLPVTSKSTHGLTSRELEVLKLMADGYSNQRIADALFISLRTVTNHVSNIHAKLEVESRTAAVAYAIRQGLA